MSTEPTVFIVDDNPGYLDSISVLIQSMGFKTKTYASAEAYLREFSSQAPGCLIVDVRMPGTGGLALQEMLIQMPICPAIIVMTGHAEVPVALRAVRQGAIDFLQKTFSESELYEAIQRAIATDAVNRTRYAQSQDLSDRFARLSTGEHEVLQRVLCGDTNKKIAAILNISRRAVEDRRARIMLKLGIDNVADLVRLAIKAGLWKSENPE